MNRSLPAIEPGVSGAKKPHASRSLSVALLGPVQQENLALQYLSAAAERAGHRVRVIAYSYRSDLSTAVEGILAMQPDVVGLGIAFQNNIQDYLELVHALREAGYEGHLTCGGHVPTFCYRELLRDAPGLDTAVRHDGEATLVELLAQLSQGNPPRNIAGLVWREDDQIIAGPVRTANGDLDALPWPNRSERLYTVGGIAVDFVITARGCIGECNYCSIAAYTEEQRKRYRLRKPEAVAREIAALYRERNARVIFVQDDLFVLPSEQRSVERFQRIRAELDKQGASDIVFWVKGRPETITPVVANALREMGAIHMFLGVETASAERLGYLGRTHQPFDNSSAIENCRKAGISPSFNFMLFDPDCTLEDVEQTLQLAELHLDLPWNVCRTEVYSGTALRSRLEAEARLRGDYRSYGYVMRNESAELLFRILRVSLHERALEIDSLLNRLISLSFARQLHEAFFTGPVSRALSERVTELSTEVRQNTIDVIREALAFVTSEEAREPGRVQRFAVSQALRVNAADRERCRRTQELWQHLNLRGTMLMARRGIATDQPVAQGWGVAAGS